MNSGNQHRIGVYGNNENDCGSNDAGIGFGFRSGITVGNVVNCCASIGSTSSGSWSRYGFLLGCASTSCKAAARPGLQWTLYNVRASWPATTVPSVARLVEAALEGCWARRKREEIGKKVNRNLHSVLQLL